MAPPSVEDKQFWDHSQAYGKGEFTQELYVLQLIRHKGILPKLLLGVLFSDIMMVASIY